MSENLSWEANSKTWENNVVLRHFSDTGYTLGTASSWKEKEAGGF